MVENYSQQIYYQFMVICHTSDIKVCHHNSPMNDAKTVQVFQCYKQLSSIEFGAGDIKRTHFGDVRE
jgi:hypothetical protein